MMISRFPRPSCSSVFSTASLIFGLLGALHAQQTSERLVKVIQATQITDAVLISNVSVAGKNIECGLFIKPPVVIQPVTPFQAGPDWLSQMTISLVNRTNKIIAFGDIHMHFLDTGDCRSAPCVGAELTVGQMPAIDAFEGRTGKPLKPEHPERPPLDWKPETTIVVHVSDYMDEIEHNLSDFMAPAGITKVNVYTGAFFFADGMRWEGGSDRYSLPDPEHPGKFKDLPADYFPGRRGNNWPPGYSQ
ncbi:MAG TPA: hypothetical protein VMF91_24145 [Bryobacteraceae bacterium]|nr:hypothetical protein [Bryobacteraceae bacterium]